MDEIDLRTTSPQPRESTGAVVWPFLSTIALMLVVAIASMETLSAVRAYVGGEGLYSKAQRDAVHYLASYASSHSTADYARYEAAIRVPLGDRAARLALQGARPDYARARQGFLVGGNNPADVDGLIRLFAMLQHVRPMSTAIDLWTRADGNTQELAKLGESLRPHAYAVDPVVPDLPAVLAKLERINQNIAPIEAAFSETLGAAARELTTTLVIALTIASSALGLFGVRLTRGRLRDRHRYAAALRESEERYRSVFDTSIDAVLILGVDGSILDANRAACLMFDVALEDLKAGGARAISRDGARPCIEALAATGWFKGDLEFRRRDGSAFTGEASAAKFADTSGASRSAIVIRDISERQRLEREQARIREEIDSARRQALEAERAKDARFRALIEHSNDMVAVVSPEGRFSYLSPAWATTLGWVPGDEAAPTLSQVVHPSDVDDLRDALERVRTGQSHVTGRSRLQHRNGKWRSISWSVSDASDVPGIDGMIINASDVTSQDALTEELQQARKMEAIGQLAGGIAHDFNNIISAVTGFAALQMRELEPGTKPHDWAVRISSAGVRARDLVQQILSFARRSGVERCPTDLVHVVREATDFLRTSLPSSTDFEIAIDAAALVSDVNASQISQLIVNLCVNANDSLNGQPGHVAVRLAELSGAEAGRLVIEGTDHIDDGKAVVGSVNPGLTYASLTVSDTGSGMEPEVMRRIFTPFFTTKPRGRGTGLGLAVVHGIIGEYSGACLVDSRSGHGTRFQVLLPLADSCVGAQDTSLRLPSLAGTERVLVVDDEPFLTEILEAGLTRLGYSVTTFNDPVEALTFAERNPSAVDVIVSDQVMPRLTGLGLLKRLRAGRPTLPVIVCTGFTDTSTEDAIRRAGATAVFYKPVAVERIAEAIRQCFVGSTSAQPKSSEGRAQQLTRPG